MTATDGLATEVVRALDAAGVKVNDIAVRSASLDDVFLTLTGHKAEDDAAEDEEDTRRCPHDRRHAVPGGPDHGPQPVHSSSSATSGC